MKNKKFLRFLFQLFISLPAIPLILMSVIYGLLIITKKHKDKMYDEAFIYELLDGLLPRRAIYINAIVVYFFIFVYALIN